MKVIAKTGRTLLVEMTATEFEHCASTEVHSVTDYGQGLEKVKIGQEVKILGLSQHLIELRNQQPDLKQLRGVFQAFLALTEPAAIEKTLEAAGIPIPLKDDTEQQDEPA